MDVLYPVIMCGHGVRPWCAVIVCGHCVRSLCAVIVCGHGVRPWCAVIVCSHCVRSLCAVIVSCPHISLSDVASPYTEHVVTSYVVPPGDPRPSAISFTCKSEGRTEEERRGIGLRDRRGMGSKEN